MMRIRTRLLFFPVLALGILQPIWTVEAPARERHAAPASNWEEDFRRCLIRKTFDAGSITISLSDSSLEVYVLWSDETRLDDLKGTKIRAEIDQNQFELRPMPMKSDPEGASTYVLGPFETIAPLWSKGRWLTLAFSDHRDRNLRVPIGNGTKAMGFLKECKAYWEKWRKRHP